MRFGVSTACLYPQETIASLIQLQGLGIKNVEIFLNSFCELETQYIEMLHKALNKEGTSAVSMHPFTSGMETFFFASEYKSRFFDGLDFYKKYFKACQILSIPRLAFHGDYKNTLFPFKKHCENYLRLREEARCFNVELCYENVVRCKCATPENIELLRRYTANDVSFVLDVKQMHRANVMQGDMLFAMRDKISLVHISDNSMENDCVLPGKGNYDFMQLFKSLNYQSFKGDIILELYDNGYENAQQLAEASEMLKALYKNKDGA